MTTGDYTVRRQVDGTEEFVDGDREAFEADQRALRRPDQPPEVTAAEEAYHEALVAWESAPTPEAYEAMAALGVTCDELRTAWRKQREGAPPTSAPGDAVPQPETLETSLTMEGKP